ncbi:amino acid adenylation domain-containing protein [Nocardioides sp. InS609-2]|uniref:amino acid adenylation domain-containing protein n=1 Tax=Nocardioides sp. InS609-2 TaxID=2760705 RepID=UPI0020BE1A2F|nr:amino acid adenylation domain-containing protein [Nocardioides sp. InS609-2]
MKQVEAVRIEQTWGVGPRRALPERRAHELFEEWSRRTPDAIAAVHRHERWTYADLDAAAERIAGALQSAGLRPEGVVAVCSERTLEWLAAIIGIFKAGGVYLPIEPAYPDDRIAGLLRRSGSTHALLPACVSSRTFRDAGVIPLPLTPAAETAPRQVVPVSDSDLAYIYFTSGSTGEPKGAACEHAGMLNHLLAKIETFELRPGFVVAQTASQCFDISLWQAFAPLLAGGSTLIVDPEAVLDVSLLLRLLSKEQVAVLQVVPSYLDVMVTRLEAGDEVPGTLRMLGVTGEAVTAAVLRRWFARCPAIPVVNAYGATEASDDTTHEVITSVSDDDLVSVGVPIANVLVDVVGADGLPLDEDGVGEITFSGVCVGRGYVNDPVRTAEAFEDDPVRPGLRRYRSGDYGQWLPDGRLRFIGRRDEQVKISGMRVEVGEVEAQLLRVPGVRTACVIVMPDGSSKRLAGFYIAESPLEDVAKSLGEFVPQHLVPRTLRWMPELPLTDNGKVDKRALADLETGCGTGTSVTPPQNPVERRIATAWAEVLGVPLDEIDRNDNFFERGGGSLAGIRLAVQLSGLVSLVDLMKHPVLADLAAAVEQPQDGASLLQPLARPEAASAAALVCLPYEAGNALNFDALARATALDDLAVWAVELPGHDIARPDEKLCDIDELARRLSEEIIERVDEPVVLWGHGAGSALAHATARHLQLAGAAPRHVILAVGAGEPADEATDVGTWLRESGALTDVDHARPIRGEIIERAFRHDVDQAEAYYGGLGREPVDVPTTVVAVPRAPGEREVAADLTTFFPMARLAPLSGLDRYFVRGRAAVAASLVRDSLALVRDGSAP